MGVGAGDTETGLLALALQAEAVALRRSSCAPPEPALRAPMFSVFSLPQTSSVRVASRTGTSRPRATAACRTRTAASASGTTACCPSCRTAPRRGPRWAPAAPAACMLAAPRRNFAWLLPGGCWPRQRTVCFPGPAAVQCDDTGLRCLSCTSGRVSVDGRCAIDCKRAWGLGCLHCTPWRCTQADATFALGTSASSLQQGRRLRRLW